MRLKNYLLIAVLFFAPLVSHAADFSVERAGAWETFKEINIEGYTQYSTYGLVFDASSCNTSSYTNDACDYAVSEGAGYGLLMAAIQKDQATFDKIMNKSFEVMWQEDRQAFGWKAYSDGSVPDTNAATDGDEDVAMALIIADSLQKSGQWKANSQYNTKAQRIINSIYESMTLNGEYLCPGNYNCTSQELNFSYFSPAWYRVFDAVEEKDHNWQRIIDKQYDLLLSVGS